MIPRPARPVPSRRSLRLAFAAGATLAVGVPSVVAAGTDDTKPPAGIAPTTTIATTTGKDVVTPTTETGGTATTTTAPAGPAKVEPLAVVDVGATGPGLDIGTAVDGPTAVANLELVAMPVAEGATVAEYSVTYSGDLADPEAPSYYGSSRIISTAQSEMPAAQILAAYQAAIETLGTFETTTSTASSEGVTSDALELDPVNDTAAVETTTAGSAPTAARALGSYDIVVSRSEDAPGLVAIEVNQSIPNTDGPVPAPPAGVADEFSATQAFADSNGWSVTGWSYRDGFNQFLGGAPFKNVDMDFSAGPGTAADLSAIGELLIAEFGPPDYESVDAESFSYSFADESSWYGSFRDYWEGNELNVSWSLSS